MRILFDQGTPVPLRQSFSSSHQVSTVYERGWSTLKNGELLQTAEKEGFEVLITTDNNLKYQQNLENRRIAIVILSTTSWPRIRAAAEKVIAAVEYTAAGNNYVEVAIP